MSKWWKVDIPDEVSPRMDAKMTFIDNHLYIFGGRDRESYSIAKYDTDSDKWAWIVRDRPYPSNVPTLGNRLLSGTLAVKAEPEEGFPEGLLNACSSVIIATWHEDDEDDGGSSNDSSSGSVVHDIPDLWLLNLSTTQQSDCSRLNIHDKLDSLGITIASCAALADRRIILLGSSSSVPNTGSGLREGETDRARIVRRELTCVLDSHWFIGSCADERGMNRFVKQNISFAANNPSAWNYLRGILDINQIPYSRVEDFVRLYTKPSIDVTCDIVDLENPPPPRGADLPCPAAIEFLADIDEKEGRTMQATELWR
ncbi:hypothetical protein C0991_007800 [Blastosporella zonata]|nr:hypothetical protein C0991_007800 [Blastosporella zonata]